MEEVTLTVLATTEPTNATVIPMTAASQIPIVTNIPIPQLVAE